MEATFAVLNPGGRDKKQLFPRGAGLPSDPGHPPVNYHAYAACCQGGFYQHVSELPEETRWALVLLRKKGLSDASTAVWTLKQRGITTFISWKESGLHQVAEALADARRYEKFVEICRDADGYLSSTPELTPLYLQAGCRKGTFIPTPYPVDVPAWDFSIPVAERSGIFIGTREFNVSSRNHLLAISAACRHGVPVTVINTDGRNGERLLNAISSHLRIVSGRLPYAEYLRVMARHRLVFQLDRSSVPGQVAGDSLLCRLPCVGGDGAIDRVAFPGLSATGQTAPDLFLLLKRLLSDETFYADQIALSQKAALNQAGFAAGKRQISQLVGAS